MEKRPLSIYILVILHLLAPVFTVIFSRLLKSEPIALNNLFTPESLAINWPGYLLQIIGAACIYICKRWSMYLYLVCISALFIFSYTNFSADGAKGSILLLILCWAINIAVVYYFLRPNLRRIYTDRKLRWWENSKRYTSSLKANIKLNDQSADAQIINISKTGLLLNTSFELTNNDHIELLVDTGKEKLSLSGEIIVHEQITNGYGVKFDKNSVNKKSAKIIINQIKNN